MGAALATPVMLLAFWLILAGRIDIEYAILGLFVAVAATAFAARLFPHESHAAGKAGARPVSDLLGVIPLAVSYLVALLRDLVWANLRVAYVVLHPKLPISPVYFEYCPPVKTTWGRVLLANSVTLTPGTLSLELSEDRFLVHALTPDSAESLVGWSAEKRIAGIEELLTRGRPR